MKKRKLSVFLPYMLAAAMVVGTVSPAAAYAWPIPLDDDIKSIVSNDDTGIEKLADLIGKDIGKDAEDGTDVIAELELPGERTNTPDDPDAEDPDADDQTPEEPSGEVTTPADPTDDENTTGEEPSGEVTTPADPADDEDITGEDPGEDESSEDPSAEAPTWENLTQEEPAEEPTTPETPEEPGQIEETSKLGTPINLMSYDFSTVKVSEEPNRLSLTGYFTIDVAAWRSVKIYIPEGAPIAAYFTVIEVPEGVDTAEFLVDSGWKQ